MKNIDQYKLHHYALSRAPSTASNFRKSLTVTLTTGALLSGLLFSTTASAETLQKAENFSELATAMQKNNRPLVLAFDAVYCHYCKRLKAEHLEPMLNNAEYTERVLIRSLEFDGDHEITDFSGKRLSASAFSNRYKVRITPTLVFLNASGEEVAERMLGYTTPDFYGVYLDRAIETAAAAIADQKVITGENREQGKQEKGIETLTVEATAK